MEPRRVAVLGGGISGLACARRLWELQKNQNSALEIILIEAGPRLGGTIETQKRDGFVLEMGPDSFISEKPWGVELSKRLGIESEIIGTNPEHRKSFITKKGRLVPVPEGFYLVSPTQWLPFLKSPLFSFPGKVRMGFELFVPRRASADDESIGSFIRRRFGNEALERAGQPMIAGIYTGDPDQLSLLATMPRFRQLEETYGSVIRGLLEASRKKSSGVTAASGPRYSLFLSYKEGMETLTKKIASCLPAQSIRLGWAVRGLDRDPRSRQWKVLLQNGQTLVVDAVCSTLPAAVTARLLKNSCPVLSARLAEIRYESVATLNLAYRRSDVAHALDGFGFVAPRTDNLSLVACTFSDRKFAGRAPEGFTLLRAFVGGAFGRRVLALPDREIERSVEAQLSRLLGIKREPLFSVFRRYPDAMVQYRLGHLHLVTVLEAEAKKVSGLYLTGSSYRGVGIPDCVHDAEIVAEAIANDLSNSTGDARRGAP